MTLIRGLHNLREAHRGCAATIGNFDGVHLGHQQVLKRLCAQAGELGCPALVTIFEPPPREFLRPEHAPARLTRLREKVQALGRLPLEHALCLRFDARLAAMDAEAFIRRIVVEGLGVRYLMVGDDFRFGRDRRGDFELLEATGKAHGFEAVRMPTFELDGERVSSTRIRDALARGDLDTARRLLGRPYRLSGRVLHGDRRGRTLGFPTANLRPGHTPVQGVFAVAVGGLDTQPLPGVANVGWRPTVDGTRHLLEVYLFDFERELYDWHLDVDFLHRIRPERRFDSLEEMRQAIVRDAEAARAYFAERGPHA